MPVENVYDLMMRLTVADEATRVLVDIGKKLADIGEQAYKAAEALEALGTRGAAAMKFIQSTLLFGAGGVTAISGGILGGLALAEKSYEPVNEQLMRMKETGLEAAKAQEAYNVALDMTGKHPAWGSLAQNLEIFNRLLALTHDAEASMRALPTVAQYAGQMGPKAAEAMIQAAAVRGIGTPEQLEDFKKAMADSFALWEASGRTVSPELLLQNYLRSRGAYRAMSPDMIRTMGLLAGTSVGAGGRVSSGQQIEAAITSANELEETYKKYQESVGRYRGKGPGPVVPQRLQEIQDLFGGLPTGMLQEISTDLNKWIQEKYVPALRKKYGDDIAQINAAVTRTFRGGADVVERMIYEGPAWAQAHGTTSPMEAARAAAGRAMTVEEAEAQRAAQSAKDLRESIYNTYTAIDAKIGESANKFEIEMDSKVLAVMQRVFTFLQGQKQEDVDTWIRRLGIGGLLGLGGGALAGTAALALALGPTGWFVVGVTALGVGMGLLEPKFAAMEKWIYDLHNWISSLLGLQPKGGTGRQFGPEEVPYDTIRFPRGGSRREYHPERLPHWGTYDIMRDLAPTGITPSGVPAVPPPPAGASSTIIVPLGGVKPGQPGYAPEPRQPAPPEGAAGAPPSGTSLPPAAPGTSMPQLPPIPFIPTSAEGQDVHAQRREIGAIINAAIQTGKSRETRPIVVSLNIDGQRISEALSTQLASLMEQPGQAPYHDGWRGWQPPDQQMTTT